MKPSMIGNYMVTAPLTVEPSLNLDIAYKIMRAENIRHLPVVKNDKLLGVVSERDLKAAMSLPQAFELSMADIMVRDVFVVHLCASLTQVARKMANKKLGSALIVNDENQIIGIFTTTDALNILADYAEGETMDAFFDEEDYSPLPAAAKEASAFAIQTDE